jgi:hypothetical protein
MTIHMLRREQWPAYFNRISRALEGKRAEIEAGSLAIGHQVEAKSLPLLGLAYDSKDDLIEVALDGLDHIIQNPRLVYVDEQAGELTSVEIVDTEGLKQIVRLSDPLMLPPPGRP